MGHYKPGGAMINVSVIGVGYWGPNIIRNLIANPSINIEMVCDINQERLKQIKLLYPSLKTVLDYRKVVKSKNVDLIAICTPVYTHYELALASLREGKHVLITKPMTASSEEGEILLNLAAQKKLKIFVDHTFLFTGSVQKMKALISAGELGDLYYFDSVRVNLGLFQHDVNVVWDLAPHDISIMNFLLDQLPQSVVANGADHLGNGLEDVAYLTFYFDNNLIAHIHINWLSPVKIRQTLIAGSKKMVVWDDNQPSEKVRVYNKGIEIVKSRNQVYNLLIQYRTGDMYCPKIDLTEALKVEIEDIVHCLNNNRSSISEGYVGLMVVKILEAAQKSLKNRGKEVLISKN